MPDQRELCDGELLYRRDGSVAWITLNRPEVHNALSPPQLLVLIELLEEASASLEIRAVVLSSNGTSFCTGADLRRVGEFPRAARPEDAPERTVGDAARLMRTGWQRLVSAVLDCEKPVIAAVKGNVAGGGLALALACDLVLSADDARFIAVFVRRGLVPDAGAAYLLPRLIGIQRAKELCFFGEDLAAGDAHRIGLVNRVVPLAELDALAADWAERLAAGPTKAIGFAKWLINRSLDSDRVTALEEEALAQELNTTTQDAALAGEAFRDRTGPPQFRGW